MSWLLRALRSSVIGQRVRFAARLLRDWRLTFTWGKSLLRSGVTSVVVLAATFWLLPGVTATGGPAALVELAVLLALIGTLMRLVLLGVAVVVGGLGVLLVGVLLQTGVMFTALRVAEGVSVGSVLDAWTASWTAAVLTALVNWLADAGSDDVFLGQTLRHMVRRQHERPATEPGVLFVQLDGLSAPLLSWAVKAGNLPNLGKWLRTGTHSLIPWHTGMPATTPASQAGILHGSETEVPAFRWYEKTTARLVVTNRPRDAAEVEARISTGRGLLADGGASISNVFSGDAPTSLLTFSNAGLPGRAHGYLAFVASPYGFARAIVLSVGEMLKEIQQARRQRFRNVYPRVPRTAAYVALRAVTNVLLRDLNVSLIAEQMTRGTPAIFCDFVDYDEVAHHAGPLRPESLQTLEGLDRVLGTLHRLAQVAGRRYEIVVLSDHGQSQGSTFSQRYGQTLEQLVASLAGQVAAATPDPNDDELARAHNLLLAVAGKPDRTPPAPPAAPVVTVASGNLAMLYLTEHPGHATVEEIGAARPALIQGLASHPGIGLVVGHSVVDGPVAFGPTGRHRLRDGHVEGDDPLLPYGPHAARDLLAHQTMSNVGDLVLISRVDQGTDEVAAFEELVGSHGGIGGWQTEAILVYPSTWSCLDRTPIGPAAIHRQLVQWLDDLGLREPAPPASSEPPLPATSEPPRAATSTAAPPAVSEAAPPAVSEATPPAASEAPPSATSEVAPPAASHAPPSGTWEAAPPAVSEAPPPAAPHAQLSGTSEAEPSGTSEGTPSGNPTDPLGGISDVMPDGIVGVTSDAIVGVTSDGTSTGPSVGTSDGAPTGTRRGTSTGMSGDAAGGTSGDAAGGTSGDAAGGTSGDAAGGTSGGAAGGTSGGASTGVSSERLEDAAAAPLPEPREADRLLQPVDGPHI